MSVGWFSDLWPSVELMKNSDGLFVRWNGLKDPIGSTSMSMVCQRVWMSQHVSKCLLFWSDLHSMNHCRICSCRDSLMSVPSTSRIDCFTLSWALWYSSSFWSWISLRSTDTRRAWSWAELGPWGSAGIWGTRRTRTLWGHMRNQRNKGSMMNQGNQRRNQRSEEWG